MDLGTPDWEWNPHARSRLEAGLDADWVRRALGPRARVMVINTEAPMPPEQEG